MKKDPSYKKRVAQVLRMRLARGEALTDNEKLWLDEYRATHKRGRPAPPPPPAFEKPLPDSPSEPIGIVDSPSVESEGPSPPPLFVSTGAPSSPNEETEDDVSSKAEVIDEETVKSGQSMASMLVDWMKQAHAEIRELGAPALSDEFIDTAFRPLANKTFVRLAKEYGADMSEKAQDYVVMAGFGGTYAYRHFVRRKVNALHPSKEHAAKVEETKGERKPHLKSVPPSPASPAPSASDEIYDG